MVKSNEDDRVRKVVALGGRECKEERERNRVRGRTREQDDRGKDKGREERMAYLRINNDNVSISASYPHHPCLYAEGKTECKVPLRQCNSCFYCECFL